MLFLDTVGGASEIELDLITETGGLLHLLTITLLEFNTVEEVLAVDSVPIAS